MCRLRSRNKYLEQKAGANLDEALVTPHHAMSDTI
jgi:hypothetical protein